MTSWPSSLGTVHQGLFLAAPIISMQACSETGGSASHLYDCGVWSLGGPGKSDDAWIGKVDGKLPSCCSNPNLN